MIDWLKQQSLFSIIVKMVKKNITIIRYYWFLDNYRIMNCDQESVWNKQTINQSINGNVHNNDESLNKSNQNYRFTRRFRQDQQESKKHLWIKSNQNYRFTRRSRQDQREWKKHLWIKSNQSNYTRNWFWSNFPEWTR